jgi:hypothetical protein
MSLSCVFRLTARKAVTAASIPPSIFFSFHPFANIWSAILKLHAIRFTIREKAHYVAIDHGDVLQIQNDVVTVRLEFKQSTKLGYRGVSVQPLRANTRNGPRTALSILKVMEQAISGRGAVVPHRTRVSSQNRSLVMQPSTQSDFTENRAQTTKLE